MRDISFAANDSGHLSFGIEGQYAFGKIKIHGPAPSTAGIQNESQITHLAKTSGQRRISRGGHRITLDYLIHSGICHAFGRTNYPRGELRIGNFAVIIDFQQDAHDQAILARVQRANPVRKLIGKHRHGAIGEINGSASHASFAIEGGVPADVIVHVRDMHLQVPSVSTFFDINRVIEVAGRFAIYRDDGQMAKVAAGFSFSISHCPRHAASIVENFLRKSVWQMVFADQNLHINTKFAPPSQDFDDAGGGWHAATRESRELDVDYSPFEFWQPQRSGRRKLFRLMPGEELRS